MLSDYHTTKNFNSGWMHNIPLMREISPYPTLHIHPDTAGKRGIKDGDWVKLESPHGWLKVKAEYYEGIRPDVVMMAHGWWHGCKELGLPDMPLTDGGANVNALYSVDDSAYDPLITAMSSQTLVEVRKYDENCAQNNWQERELLSECVARYYCTWSLSLVRLEKHLHR